MAGIVDDRGGTILKLRPLAIAIPGNDADYIWMWCANGAIGELHDSFESACKIAGIRFQTVNANEMLNRFSYLSPLP